MLKFRYDEGKKRVVAEPVQLTQEFRAFNFADCLGNFVDINVMILKKNDLKSRT